MSGNVRMGVIFAKFATSKESLKLNTVQNRCNDKSSYRSIQIAKILLREKITHLFIAIFAKISKRENIPIYGIFICNG